MRVPLGKPTLAGSGYPGYPPVTVLGVLSVLVYAWSSPNVKAPAQVRSVRRFPSGCTTLWAWEPSCSDSQSLKSTVRCSVRKRNEWGDRSDGTRHAVTRPRASQRLSTHRSELRGVSLIVLTRGASTTLRRSTSGRCGSFSGLGGAWRRPYDTANPAEAPQYAKDVLNWTQRAMDACGLPRRGAARDPQLSENYK